MLSTSFLLIKHVSRSNLLFLKGEASARIGLDIRVLDLTPQTLEASPRIVVVFLISRSP